MPGQMCPGQDTRYWRPGDIFNVTCAKCGTVTEFFKNDSKRECPNCGNTIRNPKLSLGCAQWCEHAKSCLGYDPNELEEEGAQETALVDQLIAEMKRVFGEDKKRIDHAFAVLSNAKEIVKTEDADPKVVMAAAILHDIGIPEAERKHGSASGKFQELEGPPIAREILEGLGLDTPTIDHTCRIIGSHHSANDIDTPEFRIIWDADWLVNIPDEHPDADADQLKKLVARIFRTEAGRQLAKTRFLATA